MKKGTRITLICILSILILAIVGLTIFGYVQRFSKANAEEISDNSIVNFNQYVSNTYFPDYTFNRGNGYNLASGITIGNVIYVRANVTSFEGTPSGLFFGSTDLVANDAYKTTIFSMTGVGYYDTIITCTYSYVNTYCNATFNIDSLMVIDLTQMGLDSYSLEECRELFTSSYYEYTTGTPIYLNGINAYQQGMEAVLDNMTATISTYLIGSNAFPYNNKNIQNSELIFDNQINAYYFYGVIGVPLFGTIGAGTNLQIDFNLWIPDMQGESSSFISAYPLHFGYVDNSGNLIEISEIACSKYTSFTDIEYKGSFIMPVETDTIYVWTDYEPVSDPNQSATQVIVSKSDIIFRTLNVTALLMSQYSKGRSDTIEYYQYGNPGYNEIFNLGKEYAIRHNLNNAWGQAWDFIESSFTGIGGIFQVELLPGVPIAVFILVPLMIGLIFFVVKLVKGGG